MMNDRVTLETTPEEMYQLIGEREFIRYRMTLEINRLNQQIWEMSQTIDQLRKQINGELVKSNTDDAV